jgi:YD repeat-containing protein
VSSHAYQYNDANQRTQVALTDGSYWVYEYDKLGQVISGKRFWSDGTPVPGQQHEYAFDDIGNRTSTKVGGDAAGQNLRSAAYSANALNQYSSRTIPGYLNVMGIAHPSASVTVNDLSTARKGEYYRGEISVDNSAAAQYPSITNRAVVTGSPNVTNTVVGNLLLPKTS